MGQSRYIIGIDLGTTNSAVAYVDLADPAELPPVRLFKVPQLVDESRCEARPGLPSFLYLPGVHDLPPGSTSVPWDPQRDYVVGEFAREQGARVPARMVCSAKSWLCHSGVDRQSGILPWGSPSEVPHVSPIDASARYLQHLREAWNHSLAQGRPEWSMEQSDVVLTVPASFDEVARELTVRAASLAGLNLAKLTLLEEPQAAFYSWVRSQGESWQEQLRDGQQVLVCDVGGGTTDFSLIAVHGSGTQMSLERVAVGDHLMLGGDNMDLALARHLERRLVKRSGELDARQWGSLVHACRRAKEALLGSLAEDRYAITLAGRGSRVVGGSLRIDLFQDEVVELVLDGFFPKNAFEEVAHRPRVGLQELGLPYAPDPAVTRNLASFLKRQNARPDAILFNGGAMKAALVQERMVQTVTEWFGREPIILESQSLDLAVALGAAAYGLVLVAGKGVRIRGGTARAYYVGVESGASEPTRAVCLIPFGIEAGHQVSIEERTFDLVTDRPVSFPLYCSTAPLGHDPGDIIDVSGDVYLDLPPLYTVLRFERGVSNATVPVKLGARLTELGTLQLWCAAAASEHRWELEFSLQHKAPSSEGPVSVPVGDGSVQVKPEQQAAAAEAIRAAFRGQGRQSTGDPRALSKTLEGVLGAERLAWPGALIRTLWGPLWEMVERRRLSAAHESTWFNLAGILLRPGFGDPLDGRRIDELWPVFRGGMAFEEDLWCRMGWWVLWRRVAGGLNKGQQLELSNRLAPALLSGEAVKAAGKASKKKGKKGRQADGPTQMNRQELAEMWRTAASLERLPAVSKEGLGDVALRNAVAGRGDFAFWALGRLGARVPLYGPVEEVINRDKVESWLDRLLGLDWSKQQGLALAVVQLGRLSGDSRRDISEELRRALVDRLRETGCPEHLLGLLLEVQVLQESERAQMYGDTLPTGLRLGSES